MVGPSRRELAPIGKLKWLQEKQLCQSSLLNSLVVDYSRVIEGGSDLLNSIKNSGTNGVPKHDYLTQATRSTKWKLFTYLG